MPKIDYEKIKNDDDLMLPSVDYVFCRLFGSQNSKERLISLLNSILVGQPHIKDVTITPTEYRKDKKYGKSIRLDIKATTDNGTLVNVEMQCVDVRDIILRAEFINAVMLRDYTIQQGDEYCEIPDRIIIWITMQDVTERKSCINEAVLMYKDNGIDPISIAAEHLRIFIIELSKLEKMDMSKVDNMLEGWMNFIKHPKKLDNKYLNIPVMQDALSELEFLSHDQEARQAYNDRMIHMYDVQSSNTKHYEIGLNEGVGIGREEGIEIGREEGAKQKAVEMAKMMLSKGFDVDDIVDCSGLTAEEVVKLQHMEATKQ